VTASLYVTWPRVSPVHLFLSRRDKIYMLACRAFLNWTFVLDGPSPVLGLSLPIRLPGTSVYLHSSDVAVTSNDPKRGLLGCGMGRRGLPFRNLSVTCLGSLPSRNWRILHSLLSRVVGLYRYLG